jgi:hypothetical protein
MLFVKIIYLIYFDSSIETTRGIKMKKFAVLALALLLVSPILPGDQQNGTKKEKSIKQRVMNKLTVPEIVCGGIGIVGSAYYTLECLRKTVLSGMASVGFFFNNPHFHEIIKERAQSAENNSFIDVTYTYNPFSFDKPQRTTAPSKGIPYELAQSQLTLEAFIITASYLALAGISYKIGCLLYKALTTKAVVQSEEVIEETNQ